MNADLEDEITSINSIYEASTLEVLSKDPLICALRLPSICSISLRLEFPSDYPDAPPSVLGTQSVGDGVPKGAGKEVVEKVRQVLAAVYQPGDPCIFDVIEGLRDYEHKESQQDVAELIHEETAPQDGTNSLDDELLGSEPPWTLSESITEKKSVFIARAAPVTSPAQAKQYLQYLLATDKRVARATHNITAWRIKGPNDTSYQDCDDDGETAAGGRVLHLMQLMDVWNVMVVVTRWYGGVQLGPDRFRIINTTARHALVAAGFSKEPEKAENSKKKGKK